jgi:hypothetical protein
VASFMDCGAISILACHQANSSAPAWVNVI